MLEIQKLASAAVEAALAGKNLNQVLSDTWRQHPGLNSTQRATIQDLSFGTLRYRGLLDAILTRLLQKPVTHSHLRALLIVALYQLQFTRAKPFAIVDHAVATADAIGQPAAKGLTNAVLRNFLRRQDALLAEAMDDEIAQYNHPHWWIEQVRAQYPACWQAILMIANQPPPMTLRVNLQKGSVEAYLARLRVSSMEASGLGGAGVLLDHPVPVQRLPGFVEGQVSVQDASAQMAAALLDLTPGMSVLDACSAPGGKSGHILETANVRLLALDNDADRLKRVADNMARLALRAELKVADATETDAWWDGRPFDRILIDAPCTGSGVVRRHPDIKWARRPGDTARFVVQQRRLLDTLWPTLRLGGKLLYATCSVFREENHDQLANFLSRHPDAQCLPLVDCNTMDGQIVPDDAHDGFYYALITKV